MSSTYPASAFSAKPESLPAHIESLEHAIALLNDKSVRDRILSGGSRRGYLAWMVKLLSEKCNLTNLDFLYCEPWESEGGYCAVILNNERVKSAIESITFLLARFESNPDELIELDKAGGWKRDDVLQMLREAEPSLHPQVNEGDSLDYLFAYLKSFLALCQKAQQNGEFILYVQFDG